MINITWNKKEYMFPENWDELTQRQFLAITKNLGRLIFEKEVTEEDVYARRIIALKELLDIPLHLYKKVTSGELVDLLQLLDFTKEIDLNTQLLPFIPVKTGVFQTMKLVGPKKGLNTSTFDEFIMADTHFVNISAKQDMEQAYFLFAMLYRPIRKDLKEFKASNNWNEDVREPFNVAKCKARVEMLKKYLPQEYLLAVLYFYWGFREKNLMIYKTLFPSPEKDEEGNKKKAKNNYGWADTRLELSGHKFGDFDKTGKTNWRNVIFDMHREQEKRTQREKAEAIARLKNKRR